ncbi:MAG TPA: L-rhamnose/proton symporter RhaT [Terriglobales bacterium]|nr:L-rhamnose/proton symporter RhaT [Terriglobales bacterium]
MNESTIGLLILLVAGVTNASFSLPMKFTRRWAWENTWFVWSIYSLILLPPIIAFSTVSDVGGVYGKVGYGIVATVAAFGAGWGIAQVLFGLAIDAIGIALSFSIVLGLSAALGSLIPFIRLHPEKLLSSAGFTIITGVVLVVVGVAICAVAGRRREHAQAKDAATAGKPSFARGLAIAITSGICASFMNFGVAFGGPIIDAAANSGTKPVWAINAIWLPLMMAGSIPNIFYCVYLMRKNNTGKRFSEQGTGSYWGLAFIMAAFWFGSTLLYGISTGKLGELGAVLGWPLFMSLIVITASLLGILTGEWKGTGKTPLRIQIAGVAVLVLAVFVLAKASRMV